ncbi:hydantoinase/oxoprolinase-like protein [Edaphobacter modestus]|uniref:Hydantoinase/oxoprolinase-like protein n=1 Tax=Edaphobacter modestus TaxID=388466 RepID=A0A4Q7YRZ8_9BACT|nr:hydantoinase/oxoprolinase-like protein [Edaphobacter modestus]
MTNSLNTPVEALEYSYPFRVRQYSYRDGSGGEGLYRGGDGIVREIEVLCPTRITLLTERRTFSLMGLWRRRCKAGLTLLQTSKRNSRTSSEMQHRGFNRGPHQSRDSRRWRLGQTCLISRSLSLTPCEFNSDNAARRSPPTLSNCLPTREQSTRPKFVSPDFHRSLLNSSFRSGQLS